MKKYFFNAAWLMAGAAVALSSCNSDDNVIFEGNADEPVQVINMAVSNSGDNFIGSRAADRELYSTEAKQSIENVQVIIYKLHEDPTKTLTDAELAEALKGPKTVVAQKLFTDWMNGGVSSTYANNTFGHGRQASWTLKSADLIKEEGIYMAYAVGYNYDNYQEVNDFGELVKDGTFTYPLTAATKADKVKEIFAGSAVFAVTNDQKGDDQPEAWNFNVSLTLHRQVAGTIGYFTNIPVKGNKDHEAAEGKVLRLVAAGKNNNVAFAGFNGEYTGTVYDDGNGNIVGKPSDSNVAFDVNGFGAATADAKFYGSTKNDAYTVYQINLADWFAEGDSNGDGYLNAADAWTKPANEEIFVTKGSVLAGTFLMPFHLDADKATFQLQMLDANNEIIRYWNIRLPQGDSQLANDTNVYTVGANGVKTLFAGNENVVNYSVVRNHVYSIGQRNGGDKPNPDPENPDKPEPDPNNPDKPQDLNNETLLLKVNDNWELIHEMDVD